MTGGFITSSSHPENKKAKSKGDEVQPRHVENCAEFYSGLLGPLSSAEQVVSAGAAGSLGHVCAVGLDGAYRPNRKTS